MVELSEALSVFSMVGLLRGTPVIRMFGHFEEALRFLYGWTVRGSPVSVWLDF